ncbi:glycosyltransferase [Fibrella forsythiae]|uniref:Glycosyltransferase n=1 Tax=Fibrella forsythiae TaxID=2817061 RepID=A0ABS3JCR5_9BACT|nr:glycosyltransferase [Fibrella forsythiae]MBO0947782.1 glycosyltransferase [Fibrella forsythiae]
MKILLFTHPNFSRSQSMPRYAKMLEKYLTESGHVVTVCSPRGFLYNLPFSQNIKKWLGYIDQYIIFYLKTWIQLFFIPKNVLLVFADNALGPWVPLAKNRAHVIHCHDFLAQRSALGFIPENLTGWSGKCYQSFIRRGYKQGHNFISVSVKTQIDLHTFLEHEPTLSKVVYNNVNPIFYPGNLFESRKILSQKLSINLLDGFILHVGGNQWYKNRTGVIEVYNSWRNECSKVLPLVFIGPQPDTTLHDVAKKSNYSNDIHFLTNITDADVVNAYRGATVFFFPSLEEGFGWPIAEAMASGCPVVTTDSAPMNEVAGSAGFYIKRRPSPINQFSTWASESSKILNIVINLSDSERQVVIKNGVINAKRFNVEFSLKVIEDIYNNIICTTDYFSSND